MRSIFSLLIAFTLVTAVRAQDETESPSASSEENPPSSMQAPSSLREAPSATPEAKASAQVETETAKPQASPSAPPLPEKKKPAAADEEKPAKAAKSESASATTGPDKGKPEPVVKKLENDWEAAVMKHDASFIESRVAKDFVGVSSRGKRMNKAGLIKEFKTDTDTYTSAKNGSVSVRAFDKNVVIASGSAKEVGKGKDGAAFSRSYLFTDTWVMRGERWECVASQVMLEGAKK